MVWCCALRCRSQWQFYPNAEQLGDDYEVVSSLGQGQHFGEYGCLLSQPRTSTIVALEFSELYSLTRDNLMEVYRQWPDLHKAFLTMGEPHPPPSPLCCAGALIPVQWAAHAHAACL